MAYPTGLPVLVICGGTITINIINTIIIHRHKELLCTASKQLFTSQTVDQRLAGFFAETSKGLEELINSFNSAILRWFFRFLYEVLHGPDRRNNEREGLTIRGATTAAGNAYRRPTSGSLPPRPSCSTSLH
jgi:hypothetical protein